MGMIQVYSAAERERMMKLQDVLLKAMAKKITWLDAAEIIGVTDRTMRRWRERLEEGGYSGLGDRRKGDLPGIPLHPHASADPSRRRAVVCRLDFYAAIQMDTALAVLVVAKGHDGQPQQGWPLLGEHDRDLPLGGAVNARIRPAFFPAIEIGLSLFESFEAEPFQRRFLSVPDAAFYLPFPVRMPDAARQRCGAIVLKHIAVERVQRWIVDVGIEHTLAQIVEHNDLCGATQSAKGFLVQLSPDLRTGSENQQTNRLAAITEGQYKQTRPAVLAALRVPNHR